MKDTKGQLLGRISGYKKQHEKYKKRIAELEARLAKYEPVEPAHRKAVLEGQLTLGEDTK